MPNEARVYRVPVRHSVVDSSNGGISLVIQGTVGHPGHSKESPNISIAPFKDGVDSHERGPASTAGAESLLALSVGVTSASATLCDQATPLTQSDSCRMVHIMDVQYDITSVSDHATFR